MCSGQTQLDDESCLHSCCSAKHDSVTAFEHLILDHFFAPDPTLDGPIRANHFRVPKTNPFLLRIDANRGFEAIRTNCSKILKTLQNRGSSANRFSRIDSRESPRFVLRIAGPSQGHSTHAECGKHYQEPACSSHENSGTGFPLS